VLVPTGSVVHRLPSPSITMRFSLFAVAAAAFAAVSLADELNIYDTAASCGGTPVQSVTLP
jgi:hypothetical protein